MQIECSFTDFCLPCQFRNSNFSLCETGNAACCWYSCRCKFKDREIPRSFQRCSAELVRRKRIDPIPSKIGSPFAIIKKGSSGFTRIHTLLAAQMPLPLSSAAMPGSSGYDRGRRTLFRPASRRPLPIRLSAARQWTSRFSCSTPYN